MNRQSANRLVAALLLAVFAVFYCGNTLFTHSHSVDGHIIVHSHPYLPSSNHTHTQQGLTTIASFNATLQQVFAESDEPLLTPVRISTTLQLFVYSRPLAGSSCNTQLRAPPVKV